jgi:hypothetical protein
MVSGRFAPAKVPKLSGVIACVWGCYITNLGLLYTGRVQADAGSTAKSASFQQFRAKSAATVEPYRRNAAWAGGRGSILGHGFGSNPMPPSPTPSGPVPQSTSRPASTAATSARQPAHSDIRRSKHGQPVPRRLTRQQPRLELSRGAGGWCGVQAGSRYAPLALQIAASAASSASRMACGQSSFAR